LIDANHLQNHRSQPIASRRSLFRALIGGLVALLAGPTISRNGRILAQSGKTPAYTAVLEPALEQLRREMLVPAAGVLVQSAQLGDWGMAFGTRTLHGADPVTLGDHVRIGSNTKTMTGTVTLQLVDEGKLRLNDPVAKYRPDVPNGDRITIDQLLRMRSGLYNYSESLELNLSLDETPERIWKPDELLAIAYERPLMFAPGAMYSYSNTNYILLGLIIEQLTGDSAENQFQQRLFAPLGLSGSLLPTLTSSAIPDPRPRGYQFGTNVETISSQVLPSDQQAQAAAGTLLPTDVTDENPSWAWTAGSAISTAGDLARYSQALVGGGLLSSQLQAQRLTTMEPTDPTNPNGTSFGLGLAKIGPMYGFIGNIPGYNSFAGHDPSRGITLIVWTSLGYAPDGRPTANVMAAAAASQLAEAIGRS
jgi:CubicO group peptidase (beta-lactamase class C family)